MKTKLWLYVIVLILVLVTNGCGVKQIVKGEYYLSEKNTNKESLLFRMTLKNNQAGPKFTSIWEGSIWRIIILKMV